MKFRDITLHNDEIVQMLRDSTVEKLIYSHSDEGQISVRVAVDTATVMFCATKERKYRGFIASTAQFPTLDEAIAYVRD